MGDDGRRIIEIVMKNEPHIHKISAKSIFCRRNYFSFSDERNLNMGLSEYIKETEM